MTAIVLRCPRCRSAYPGQAPRGIEIGCDSCGHRWTPAQASDEYLPAEGDAAAAPLTERRTPPRARVSDGALPFDRLEAESQAAGGERPVSELAFRPSTDNLNADRSHCPVCGHSFVGKPGADEQRCPACGTSFLRSTGRLSAGAVSGGDRLIGRVLRGCQIDRKLGEGGMGAVYHARQLSLDRSVAIKVLPPELARNRNFIQRFEREAKSLARINHANILQIYDFGEDVQLGVYFMVIEYVDGWDLGEVLRRQPTLSPIETLDIVRQALLGLEQAAEKGVIHRDIKPDNLMVATSGLCKVSDFGLAKGSAGDSEVTSVGVRVGTPAFMSPEQCDGVEVDSRSDVYNLGCTAFLMLTGQLPYDGETPFSIMLKHKVDPVPSLRAHRQDIDPRIDVLVQRMMQKKPDDRCFELRELIDEAERLLVHLTGTASVLRKTNGPIRALVEHAAGSASSGRRGGVASSIDDQPAAPIPGAKPSGRQRAAVDDGSRRPAPTVIPDWLKPVEAPAPAPAQPSPVPAPPSPVPGSRTSPAPAIGSRTSPAPAVGSRTGPAPAIGSRSGPAPAVGHRAAPPSRLSGPVPAVPPPTLATPFPGMVTPLPGERKASSSSSALAASGLERVRERGIRAEIASIAAGAERLAAAGNWDQAASEWRRAAQLARDGGEGRRLAELAADATRRARRRRRVRAALVAGISAVLLGVNLWIWPPVVHNLVAERERARLDALADPAERSRRLREFAALNQGGWRWYRAIFRTGYEVRAAAAAAAAAEQRLPAPAPPRAHAAPRPAAPAAPAAALAELERLAQDPAVALQRVAEAARPLAADARAAAVLAEAESRLAAATAALAQVDAARRDGRHGEALDAAARLAAEHPRAGALLAGLPLPGRVRATDADTGAAIPAARLQVDGVELAGADGRFCRSRTATLQLDVQAPGYAPRRLTVPAGGDAAELVVDAGLGPAPAWRIAAPSERPAWLRLHRAGAAVAVLAPGGAAVVDPANGALRQLTLPGTRLVPWWHAGEGSWFFATADGEQRQLLPTLDRAVPVRRLAGAPLALLEIELVYRAGGRLALSVEEVPGGRALVARDGLREAWRLPGLAGTADPLLRRVDDKIVVVDDLALRVVEEDGAEASRQALAAARTGPAVELPGGRLLVATAAGVQLVQLGNGGARIVAHPWLAEAGPAVPAASGEQLLLARRGDPAAELLHLGGDTGAAAWRTRLPARPLHAALAGGFAVVADEAGQVVVMRAADGAVVRRIAHGAPAAAPPVVVGGAIVVADQTGAIAGYRLPQ